MNILLDNGHGVDTPGKRSPVWEDGSQLMEYEFNRAIVKGVSEILRKKLPPEHKVFVLVPEISDISLYDRVHRANAIKGDNLFISVHANAGGGTGWEIFTSPGETKADLMATVFGETAQKYICDKFKLRSDFGDGDVDKEENFYVLRNTKCPAVLTENLFMDNEADCRFIMSQEGREVIIALHVEAILETIKRMDNL